MSNLTLLRELNRIKVMFQRRTLAAIITEQPHHQPSARGNNHSCESISHGEAFR